MKKVSFYRYIEVIFIPMISELENYKDLWWTENDKRLAHKAALFELRRLMFIHPSMNLTQAKTLLYQRNTIDYRRDYFSDSDSESPTAQTHM
jgi:hypothetical protein